MGTYSNMDTNLTYLGSWNHLSSQSYSNSKDASISFSFEGTGFRLTSLAASNRGIANIYIDGVAYSADGYSSTNASKVIFSKDGLTNKKHDVKIVVTNSKNSNSSGYYVSLKNIVVLK